MVMIILELCVELEWKLTVEISLNTMAEVIKLNKPIVIPTVILIVEPPKKLSL